MRFIVSFPTTAFNSITEAFNFGDALSEYNKVGILSDARKGFMDYDPIKICKYLTEQKSLNYQIIENYSSSCDFGSTTVFRYNVPLDQQILIFSFDGMNYNRIIERCAQRGFTFAYATDYSKSHWQNEKFVGNYKTIGRGKSHDHLPKKWDPILSPIVKSEVIDTFYLPGHMIETYGISMMAASEMYFGPNAWKFFDKKKVMSFPQAIEIKEMDHDIIYVKLFEEDEPDYEDPKILSIQKFFRDYTDMNKIEKKQVAIVEENAKKDKTPPIQFLGDAARDHPMN